MNSSNLAEISEADIPTGPPSPEAIGEMLYRIIADEVAKKNLVTSNRPNLSVSKQVDIPGEFRIDVEYQVEPDSIKDHSIVRIRINPQCGIFSLYIRDEITPKQFDLPEYRKVKRLAKVAIVEF